MENALSRGDEFLTHSCVVIESVALVHRRLGFDSVRRFLLDLGEIRIRWVDQRLHQAAVARFVQRTGSVSLVDETSFAVVRDQGITHAFAFDSDFDAEGIPSIAAS